MLHFLISGFEYCVGITHRLPVAEPGMVRLRCHQDVGVAPSTSLSFHHHCLLVLKKNFIVIYMLNMEQLVLYLSTGDEVLEIALRETCVAINRCSVQVRYHLRSADCLTFLSPPASPTSSPCSTCCPL